MRQPADGCSAGAPRMAETKTSDICECRLRTPDSIAPRKNTGDRKYQCPGKKQTLRCTFAVPSISRKASRERGISFHYQLVLSDRHKTQIQWWGWRSCVYIRIEDGLLRLSPRTTLEWLWATSLARSAGTSRLFLFVKAAMLRW